MAFCSSPLKRKMVMALSSRRKSSPSSLPAILQSPPCAHEHTRALKTNQKASEESPWLTPGSCVAVAKVSTNVRMRSGGQRGWKAPLRCRPTFVISVHWLQTKWKLYIGGHEATSGEWMSPWRRDDSVICEPRNGFAVLCWIVSCVCVLAPGWDSSRSQHPADKASASRAEEGPPASRRRCGSFSLIWPDPDNNNKKTKQKKTSKKPQDRRFQYCISTVPPVFYIEKCLLMTLFVDNGHFLLLFMLS